MACCEPSGRRRGDPPSHQRALSRSLALAGARQVEASRADLLKRARPTKKFVSRFAECRSSFLRRLWNSSAFMCTFRRHITASFNGRRDHRHTRGRAGGTGGERGACAGPQEEFPAVEGGSRTGRAEAVRPGAGARRPGGRRADPGAPVRRSHEAGGASRGGRNQKPDSLQPVLPRAAAGEGAHRPNRSRTSELAASGV